MAQEERGAPSPQKPPMRAREPIPPDTILIGKKPIMAYATAVMMHFQSGAQVLTVKARGRAISTAVDVVEVTRRRFFAGKLAIKEVSIGTQAIGEGSDIRNVSTIEIKLEKTG
jgi:DNA-binding protein